ncbi:MAG: dihydropteroate synthase [Candidatus Omnitrophica bacterium]|nr:dihydropteroate synthase [Candidatus Omnitrophota bacterium]
MRNQKPAKLFNIKAVDRVIQAGHKTLVMGIVNATPDSFSRDGCFKNKNDVSVVVRRALHQVKCGADIIDIGGESSRPGSLRLSEKEEMARVIPAITLLAKKIEVPISVDTYKTKVAQVALDAGAVIVNNIQGTCLNKSLIKMITRYKAAIVLMHMQGTPRTMQKNVSYRGDVVEQIIKELVKAKVECLNMGMLPEQIILDPGIGFGKTVEHNLEILARLNEFSKLKCPVLVGTSCKNFIGQILDKNVEERLNGTLATVCVSIMNGAHIVRVHDVKENKEAAAVVDEIVKLRK